MPNWKPFWRSSGIKRVGDVDRVLPIGARVLVMAVVNHDDVAR